jgi:drug/metabolite transporter (DMT)-like permease
MENIPFLLLSIFLGTGRSIISKKVAQDAVDNKKFFFSQSVMFLTSGAVIALLESIDIAAMEPVILLYAVLYGLLLIASQWMYTFALRYGRASICSMIYSFGFIFPTMLGVFLWDETLTLYKSIGLVLVFAVIILSAKVKGDGEAKGGKFYIFALLAAMLASGGLGILQQLQQRSGFAEQKGSFLLVAFILASVVSLTTWAMHTGKTEKRGLVCGAWSVGTGLCFGGANMLNTMLAGRMESTVFFPVTNIGCVLASTLCGILFFREKMTTRVVLLLVLGICAVVLLSAFG